MRHELVAKLQAALPSLGQDLVFANIAAALIAKGILVAQEYHSVLCVSSDRGRAAMLVDILSGKEDAAFQIFVEILKKDYDWLADEIEAADATGDVTDSVPVERPYIARDETPPLDRVVNNAKNCLQSTSTERLHSKRSHSPTTCGDLQAKRSSLGTKTPSQGPCERSHSSPTLRPTTQQCHKNDLERRHVDPQQLCNVGVTTEMMNLVKKNHRTSQNWTSLAHALGLTRFVHKIRVKMLVYGEDLDGCIVNLLQEWSGESPKDANLSNLLNALRGEGFNDVADELVEKFVPSG